MNGVYEQFGGRARYFFFARMSRAISTIESRISIERGKRVYWLNDAAAFLPARSIIEKMLDCYGPERGGQ